MDQLIEQIQGYAQIVAEGGSKSESEPPTRCCSCKISSLGFVQARRAQPTEGKKNKMTIRVRTRMRKGMKLKETRKTSRTEVKDKTKRSKTKVKVPLSPTKRSSRRVETGREKDLIFELHLLKLLNQTQRFINSYSGHLGSHQNKNNSEYN